MTLLGSTIATRLSASLCAAAHCPELVTNSLAEYKALAVLLASDANRYWQLRTRLADARKEAPLFDWDKSLRYLEEGYETAWSRALDRRPPADIVVAESPL